MAVYLQSLICKNHLGRTMQISFLLTKMIIIMNRHGLHEAAAGTLSPEQVRYDIKSVINSQKVEFVKAEVQAIDVNRESRNDRCRYTYI